MLDRVGELPEVAAFPRRLRRPPGGPVTRDGRRMALITERRWYRAATRVWHSAAPLRYSAAADSLRGRRGWLRPTRPEIFGSPEKSRTR